MLTNQLHRVIFSFTFVLGASAMAQTEPSANMGKGIFDQPGANSCMYCHGTDGKGGKIPAAARLDQPKTWKGYKALGGDAALAKNRTAFLASLSEATLNLITKGAIAHNATYKKPGFDWAKTGGPYNAQMLGLSGAPSAAWLNKYKDKGVTKDIAAKSVYLHVQTLDTQGLFK